MQSSIYLNKFSSILLFPILFAAVPVVSAQNRVITLKEAITSTLSDFGGVKAKKSQVSYFKNLLKAEKAGQLPDFNLSAQQDYGTINGQSGPSYAFRGLNVSSSGPPLPAQNYHAAFGGLYLANINWDLFSFGKVKNLVTIAGRRTNQALADLNQEEFQDEIKVSANYLNLLASIQLEKAQYSNLQRALSIQHVVKSRVLSGLNAGVDSSLASADVSAARISLINIRETENEQQAELSNLLGNTISNYTLDTLFIHKIPAEIDTAELNSVGSHPFLTYSAQAILINQAQVKYLRSQQYPTFSVFSVFQGKGSGFSQTYGAQNLTAYSQNYGQGIKPTISNYLIGAGIIWNISSLAKTGHLIDAQRFQGEVLKNTYEQVKNQLDNQLTLSGRRVKNAWSNLNEAPVEVRAATEAYRQKRVLYSNGLATIVDLSTALYTLNRAETDQQIAYNNIWQALLFRAAARGDFQAFYKLL